MVMPPRSTAAWMEARGDPHHLTPQLPSLILTRRAEGRDDPRLPPSVRLRPFVERYAQPVWFSAEAAIEFVPSISFYAEAASRRVRTTMAGRSTWVHSAEVLAVFKLLFFRAKDLVDVERMVQVRGTDFDRSFVRDALVKLLDEDERIERWDEICARVSQRPGAGYPQQ